MNPTTVELRSEGEILQADLYGELHAGRAAILCHGTSWDATGWRDIGPLFAARGVPALALNFRGYDGSTGKTTPPASVVADVHAAKKLLKDRGVTEIALVGSSLGGHAVLGSSFEGDVECVVSISAPVQAVDDALSKKITGRKLFICANEDQMGATPHVLRTFEVCASPKTLLMFGAKEHSRGLLTGPNGPDVIAATLDFVTGRR